MSRVLPIAVVQAAPLRSSAPDGFHAQVHSVLARFPQTRLVVFPELHLHGVDQAELADAAEPLDGPRLRALGDIAADLGIWLVPGTVCERGPQGQLFNTAVVLSPQGQLIAWYRKIFPWRPYEPFDPGDRFVVFDLEDAGRAGFSVCYDAWFPEVTRHLAWLGAEVVLNLVQTTTCDRTQELVLAQANAIVNQVFVVSVNCAAPLGTGRSVVVDPEGLVRTMAADANQTVLTDVLDLEHVQRARAFGTAGLTRPWSQFQSGDLPISLPLYDGAIDPQRWSAPPRPENGLG